MSCGKSLAVGLRYSSLNVSALVTSRRSELRLERAPNFAASRVLIESAPVTVVSDEYGVSRPTFYEAKAAFDASGVAGLVPKKRGPRGPRKLRGDVLVFLRKQLVPGEPIRARELAERIRKEFDVDVHARTIERAFRRKKTPR